MAQLFQVHPEHPQPRLVKKAAEIAKSGGLLAMPTDAAYSLAGVAGYAPLLERIRRIRDVDERHHFTLMCRDLSEIATYARVDNSQYRLLKAITPGAYTLILQGSKELPRRVLHPKRKTIGLRVPSHPFVLALLEELNEPLLTSTLILPGDEFPLNDAELIRQRLEKQLDLVIDAGPCGTEMTTVVNLAEGEPILLRAGKGELAPLGLSST
ncbi:MAG: threonylcarbamoyl-AMP synthase [Rhodocyclaceae bacterium]|nr:threonylcarbamoyl-AMP synthase [Rhodocyclaceae bacterium]MBP7079969.1 threonylcarbamoyl-AMP synthase [Rhodocyclaceae bacterium]